jgi:uncharacterized protein YjbJ (UPF0337 family)
VGGGSMFGSRVTSGAFGSSGGNTGGMGGSGVIEVINWVNIWHSLPTFTASLRPCFYRRLLSLAHIVLLNPVRMFAQIESTLSMKEYVMNKNEAAGKAEQAKGAVKEKVGEWTGNKDLETSGNVDQVKGKVRETAGTVERKVDEAVDDVKEENDRTRGR